MYATNPNYELKKVSDFKPNQLSKEYNAANSLAKPWLCFPPKKRWMIMFRNNDRYLPKVFQRVACDSNKIYFATILQLEKSISNSNQHQNAMELELT